MLARTLGVLGGLVVGAAAGCQATPAPLPQADTAAFAATASAPTAAPITPSSTAGAAAQRTTLSPEAARALAKRAWACEMDPRCRKDEAARLLTEAMEAGAIQLDCFDLYYGIGLPADAARARTCFERAVAAETPCDGASPSLQRTFLGVMLLDAQGGPRDRARGEALFAGCTGAGFVPASVEAREKSGANKPVDFCADLGGTTLDQTECARIDDTRGAFEARNAVKDLFAALAVDDAGFALWSRAEEAWSRFSSSDAAYARDLWRGGTGAPTVYELTLAAHRRERVELLQALLTPPSSPDPPDEAERALKSAESVASVGADAARKKLLADAEADFRAYRAAEEAFARRAFAARYGSADAAARAAEAAVSRRRAAAVARKG